MNQTCPRGPFPGFFFSSIFPRSNVTIQVYIAPHRITFFSTFHVHPSPNIRATIAQLRTLDLWNRDLTYYWNRDLTYYLKSCFLHFFHLPKKLQDMCFLMCTWMWIQHHGPTQTDIVMHGRNEATWTTSIHKMISTNRATTINRSAQPLFGNIRVKS